MLSKKLLLAILVPLTLTACGEPPDTRPGKPVAHRQAAFKRIKLAFEPMGIQLRNKGYNADQFIVQAKQLSSVKDGPWQYFGADTNYPPTHATDEVWSKPDVFEAKRKAFFKAVDDLVAATESRSEERVRAAYEAAYESCRQCHDTFKD